MAIEDQSQELDSESRMFTLGIPFLGLIEVAIVLSIALTRWNPPLFLLSQAREEKLAVALFTLLIIQGILLSIFFKRIRPAALLGEISLLGILTILIVAQVFMTYFPASIPNVLLANFPELDPAIEESRKGMVEYLNESPWIKFRANIPVRSVGSRGSNFHYFWTTDSLGFKNSAEVANLERYDAVAIGDSFTEGMGVAVDDTWPSLLSKSGFSTYNLGVQGYAPQQLTGSLKKFGLKKPSKIVIFGYFPGFEDRALIFADVEKQRLLGKFTGGIDSMRLSGVESLNTYLKERRAIERPLKILNGVIDLIIYGSLQMPHSGAPLQANGNEFALKDVMRSVGENRMRFDESARQFQLTLRALDEARTLAEESGRQFVVLLFHTRALVYFERFLHRPIPESGHYEQDVRKALLAHCRANNIRVIETLNTLKDYVNNLPEPLDLSKLPYFQVDGHMNEIGHKLVADHFLATIRTQAISMTDQN